MPVAPASRGERGTPVVLSNRNREALIAKLNLVKEGAIIQGWKPYKPRSSGQS